MPADPEDSAVDVEALTKHLEQVTEQRRQSGEYPPDLEWQLDDHFRRIAARATDMGDLNRLLEDVKRSAEMGRHRIDYASGAPLGSQVHKAIGKAVSRQTDGALQQVSDFARAVLVLLQAIVESRPVNETVLPDINARLDYALERLAAYERLPEGADPHLLGLAARVDRLESSLRDVRSVRTYSRSDLDRELRGPREQVVADYRGLAKHFNEAVPIIDVGCGAGEMLEVLSELGLEARGVDIDPDAVEQATSHGLAATRGDGLAYLESMPDKSLGGIFLGYVLEELPPETAVHLLRLTGHKLRQGGRLLVLGSNPESLYLQATSWYADPDRVRPVPAGLVEFLLRQWSFAEVAAQPAGRIPDGLESMPAVSDSGDPLINAINKNVERLNQLLYAPVAFAIYATR